MSGAAQTAVRALVAGAATAVVFWLASSDGEGLGLDLLLALIIASNLDRLVDAALRWRDDGFEPEPPSSLRTTAIIVGCLAAFFAFIGLLAGTKDPAGYALWTGSIVAGILALRLAIRWVVLRRLRRMGATEERFLDWRSPEPLAEAEAEAEADGELFGSPAAPRPTARQRAGRALRWLVSVVSPVANARRVASTYRGAAEMRRHTQLVRARRAEKRRIEIYSDLAGWEWMVAVAMPLVVLAVGGWWLDAWWFAGPAAVLVALVSFLRGRLMRNTYVFLQHETCTPVLSGVPGDALAWADVEDFVAIQGTPPDELIWMGGASGRSWLVAAKLRSGDEIELWPMAFGDGHFDAHPQRQANEAADGLNTFRDRALAEAAGQASGGRSN